MIPKFPHDLQFSTCFKSHLKPCSFGKIFRLSGHVLVELMGKCTENLSRNPKVFLRTFFVGALLALIGFIENHYK